MNAKISMFVICVETILYLLLHNLHDCTFKNDSVSPLHNISDCQNAKNAPNCSEWRMGFSGYLGGNFRILTFLCTSLQIKITAVWCPKSG